jgi:DNA-binding MarR family transcriptional regulator
VSDHRKRVTKDYVEPSVLGVLEVCLSGSTPEMMAEDLDMSRKDLTLMRRALTRMDLIKRVRGSTRGSVYVTTPKGRDLLRNHKDL